MPSRELFKKINLFPDWFNWGIMSFHLSGVLLYSPSFRRYSEFIRKSSESYDNSKLLISLVNYSILKIPYYKQIYKRQINNIREFRDNIGFIDKETVSEQYKDFILPDLKPRKFDIVTTGGTSNKPLQLVLPKKRYIVELATLFQMWANVGFKNNMRAVIRNHRLPVGKDCIINPFTNEVIFDGFRLNQEYFSKIYEVISKHRIKYIHCYPSTAFEFAKFLYYDKRDVSFIRAFLSGSENIFTSYKNMIKGNLGIDFYNWYGHSEKLVLGGYCTSTDYYHIEPTYGYFELIDENGKEITEPGKTGEIVGTTLNNYNMPLIRYKTGDFAEYAGNYCPYCKRTLPLIKNIKGRWSGEKIYNKDGTFITTTALNLHDDLYRVIDGLQYIQEKKGNLTVLIIKSPVFQEEHEKRILNHYRSKMNPDSIIEIEFVDHLIRQQNGKFLHIISRVEEINI